MRNAKNPSESSIARVAFWDAWEAENAGKIVLSADDFALIEAMHTALMRDPEVAALFAEGESEVTLRWVDEATGLRCKARADRWNRRRRYMADLKTTDDASRSEEHTSELQSLMRISYAVFCLKKKTTRSTHAEQHIQQ